MLLEFSVANFRSFKDLQTLSMVAQPIRPKYSWLEGNLYSLKKGNSLLKTKALYGANASGKSNLIKALVCFIKIINHSVKDESILSHLIESFYLHKSTINEPSFFQMVFMIDGVRYRYGFEADEMEIKSEWLFGRPNIKEVEYYTREENNISYNEKKFPEGGKFGFLLNEDNEIVRPNALFLSAAASLNGKLSKKIVDAISNIIVISGMEDSYMKKVAYNKMENEADRLRVVRFLNESGIDLEDFVVEEYGDESISSNSLPRQIKDVLKTGNKVKFLASVRTQYEGRYKPHSQIKWNFEHHESDGTQKMLLLSPFILESLTGGRLLVIDEFEARLHSVLTRSIVEAYHSKSINKNNAQFLFTTHDTNLLSSKLMRRDQICFSKKNKYGESVIYSLADIKGVRNDESYEKNYLLGKYDAIPKIRDFGFASAKN